MYFLQITHINNHKRTNIMLSGVPTEESRAKVVAHDKITFSIKYYEKINSLNEL